MNEPIVRIAARGDGVTASGRHVAFGVPGDVLLDDGALAPGRHHQEPPCRHFPECGGCQLQHADDSAYAGYLISRIESALASHRVETQIAQPHLSPPRSRRRATVHALKAGGGIVIGFNAEKSHQIIDMRECHVLRPEVFERISPLRGLLASILQPKHRAQIHMTLADQGIDMLIKGVEPDGVAAIEALTQFCEMQQLARLSIDGGYGPETFYEPEPCTVHLAGITVSFPVAGFLQATEDGQAALVTAVRAATAGGSSIADLFAGIGTFALGTGARYAAEAAREAALALKKAAPDAQVEHRDLYRRPLDPEELARFGAVILDPPRAGAAEQIAALARSTVGQVAYVSCNPSTFARDAKTLIDGGYTLQWVRPVGQFRWSTHVELAAAFTR